MRRVFLGHPLAGDVEANIAAAKRWVAWLIRQRPGCTIVAPWITYAEVLDDSDPAQRELARTMTLAQLATCQEAVFAGGAPALESDGIADEIRFCRALGITVTDYRRTHGEEPPTHG